VRNSPKPSKLRHLGRQRHPQNRTQQAFWTRKQGSSGSAPATFGTTLVAPDDLGLSIISPPAERTAPHLIHHSPQFPHCTSHFISAPPATVDARH
jgi:hypothetical protein